MTDDKSKESQESSANKDEPSEREATADEIKAFTGNRGLSQKAIYLNLVNVLLNPKNYRNS